MKTKRRKEATPEQKAAAHAKRADLIALSRAVKRAMESGQMPDAETVNDGIVSIYQERTGKTDFRGFLRWTEEGFQVKKGEHGFPVWGKPRAAKPGESEPGEGGGEGEEGRAYRLFPLAYLFHAEQVEPRDPNRPHRERTPRPTPTPREEEAPRQKRNEALAERLRTLADAMDKEIEAKRNPSIGNQNPTPRRHRIAEGMRREGETLAIAQTILRTAADCHAGETRPAWLGELDSPPAPSMLTVTSKAAAIAYAQRHADAIRDAMRRSGSAPTGPDWQAKYRAALGSLIGSKIAGFFPTGDKLAAQVAEMAELDSPEAIDILEPSAGTGSLVLAAIERINAGSKIYTVERTHSLSAVLDIIAEGHPGQVQNVGPMDFLSFEDETPAPGTPTDFDRIIMNPPFENGQDMQHVQAAYSLLRPGGILVAIVCANCFYRTDGEYPAFRDWLASIGAETEKAPEDAFAGTIRSTKTAAYTVKIRKA